MTIDNGEIVMFGNRKWDAEVVADGLSLTIETKNSNAREKKREILATLNQSIKELKEDVKFIQDHQEVLLAGMEQLVCILLYTDDLCDDMGA